MQQWVVGGLEFLGTFAKVWWICVLGFVNARNGKPKRWRLQQVMSEPLLLCGAEVGEMNVAN